MDPSGHQCDKKNNNQNHSDEYDINNIGSGMNTNGKEIPLLPGPVITGQNRLPGPVADTPDDGRRDDKGSGAAETPIFTGKSKPWDSGSTPNSIYEQLNPDGTVKSRAFYDEKKGRQFNRQDFDHEHFDKKMKQYYQPHEHSYYYNEKGYRDGVLDGPLTPGYNNRPTQ